MAVPASFEQSNAVLDRPPDMTDDECAPLCVARCQDSDGNLVTISCWKLTAEELAEIKRTGRVWLGVYGLTMPPAWISGQNPFAGS